MQHFNEAGLPQPLFHRLEQIGFTTPTPIQAQAIPPALEGRDILGTAQTGTGKTAAYGIPLVTQLLNSPRGTALVLLPTRELAVQVMQALKQFVGSSKIKTALLIGGEGMPQQFRQLQNNPRLIVGTPGRINDHLTRGKLKLHDTNFLVLDEVDRMLDMGFGVQLDAIGRFLTAKRQTLMFSATLPDNIKKLSGKYLSDPVRISVGSTRATATNVTQENIKLADSEKYPRLLDELNERTGSIIIFVKTKHGADNMAKKLSKLGHQADALHGDLRQSARNRVVSDFRKQKYRILVATDVAARGLDISHIEHVVNYDLPQNPEDYIHRIGRTARAGAEGAAVNFLCSADNVKWKAIQLLLDPSKKPEDIGERNRGGGNGNSRNRNRKPYGQRRSGGGGSRQEGNRSEGGQRRSGGGSRQEGNRSEGGQRRSGGGSRQEGNRSEGGQRRSGGGSRQGGNRSEGGQRRSGGGSRQGGGRSEGGQRKAA